MDEATIQSMFDEIIEKLEKRKGDKYISEMATRGQLRMRLIISNVLVEMNIYSHLDYMVYVHMKYDKEHNVEKRSVQDSQFLNNLFNTLCALDVLGEFL